MKWYPWLSARIYSIFIVFCLICILTPLNIHARSSSPPGQSGWKKIYLRTGLDEHLSYKVFAKAMAGRKNWSFPNSDLLTIIDFSQPSSMKRCYVIDLKKEKLLHRTYVAHGRKTGMTYARQFSNIPESHQSSLGFFRTAETYRGKHGYSLRLDGLERNINDQARDRAIVMHAADYADEEFVQQHGRLGRSLGCPALPPDESSAIIRQIKEGSCLFVYANDRRYLSMSSAFSPSG
jgi:hypothetical protein